MTIPSTPARMDGFYKRRADLLVRSGNSDECWERMGVANRHLQRVETGILPLVHVEQEINRCFSDVERWLENKQTIFSPG